MQPYIYENIVDILSHICYNDDIHFLRAVMAKTLHKRAHLEIQTHRKTRSGLPGQLACCLMWHMSQRLQLLYGQDGVGGGASTLSATLLSR